LSSLRIQTAIAGLILTGSGLLDGCGQQGPLRLPEPQPPPQLGVEDPVSEEQEQDNTQRDNSDDER